MFPLYSIYIFFIRQDAGQSHVCLFTCLSVCLRVLPESYLSVYLSVCLRVLPESDLSVYLSVCLRVLPESGIVIDMEEDLLPADSFYQIKSQPIR